VRRTAPVFEKTAKSVFTICTYCVAPTSPFVSGGRQLQPLGRLQGSPNGRQMPSKFWMGPEIGPAPFRFWTTGSCASGGRLAGASDSIGRALSGACGTGSTCSELTAGETPWNVPITTCGPNVGVVAAAAANDVTSALLARAMPTAWVAPLSPVPAPASATATAASTSGSDATTSVRRLRLNTAAICGTSFRAILVHPQGLCDSRRS